MRPLGDMCQISDPSEIFAVQWVEIAKTWILRISYIVFCYSEHDI